MALFEPGHRGPGRPKGSVNRKWANPGYWFELIEANMGKLTPAEKVAIGKWGLAILVEKMKGIDNPEESKANAEDAMKLLKEMESKVKQ